MRRGLAIALFLASMSVGFAGDDAAKKDLEKMQGKWAADRYTQDGKAWDANELKTLQLTIKGNLSILTVGAKVAQGTYKLDAGKTPKELDIAITDGADKGKRKLAIYEFDGTTLRICVSPTDSKDRPREFASKAGSGVTLEVWRRTEK